MRSVLLRVVVCAAMAASVSAAFAKDAVFQANPDNGYFTPFSSSTPAGVKYGDGGWLSNWQPAGFQLTEIDLVMCAYNSTVAGTTDLLFTFNDGDPSGLVFGSGAALYSTTIQGVAVPATTAGGATYFDVTIPLPNVMTLGGYNNVGFSVGVQNFSYAGSLGFACSSTYGQQIGYYTNNASYYNGGWSLFAFSSDPHYGVGNFAATMYTPEPAALLSALLLGLIRRR